MDEGIIRNIKILECLCHSIEKTQRAPEKTPNGPGGPFHDIYFPPDLFFQVSVTDLQLSIPDNPDNPAARLPSLSVLCRGFKRKPLISLVFFTGLRIIGIM
jgi:hypothetical protein